MVPQWHLNYVFNALTQILIAGISLFSRIVKTLFRRGPQAHLKLPNDRAKGTKFKRLHTSSLLNFELCSHEAGIDL